MALFIEADVSCFRRFYFDYSNTVVDCSITRKSSFTGKQSLAGFKVSDAFVFFDKPATQRLSPFPTCIASTSASSPPACLLLSRAPTPPTRHLLPPLLRTYLLLSFAQPTLRLPLPAASSPTRQRHPPAACLLVSRAPTSLAQPTLCLPLPTTSSFAHLLVSRAQHSQRRLLPHLPRTNATSSSTRLPPRLPCAAQPTLLAASSPVCSTANATRRLVFSHREQTPPRLLSPAACLPSPGSLALAACLLASPTHSRHPNSLPPPPRLHVIDVSPA